MPTDFEPRRVKFRNDYQQKYTELRSKITDRMFELEESIELAEKVVATESFPKSTRDEMLIVIREMKIAHKELNNLLGE